MSAFRRQTISQSASHGQPRVTRTQWIVIALLLVGATLFWALDLHRYLSLEQLQQSRDQLQGWRAAQPWLLAGGLFLGYVALAALSLPGAAIMTLAIGAIFGLIQGTVLVSFASTIGGTLAFLISRTLLRDFVRRRYAGRIGKVEEGFSREGTFYLLSLRLVPVFPFFLVNLLMGLTPISTLRFFLVSQIGMLPGTLVYVNAGTQLAKVQSLGDIFSPLLLLSFTLLGLLPLLARWLLKQLERRRQPPPEAGAPRN